MTEREYRQDDRDEGYCPVCTKPLTGLTVAARGYCEQHGWQWAEWNKPQGNVVCGDCGAIIAWEGETPDDCLRCGSVKINDPLRLALSLLEGHSYD